MAELFVAFGFVSDLAKSAYFLVRAFLLNHDFGCISSVFGLPAPVSVVSREGLALQGGKMIEESESSDIWSSDKSVEIC